jgi:hypothetical protein
MCASNLGNVMLQAIDANIPEPVFYKTDSARRSYVRIVCKSTRLVQLHLQHELPNGVVIHDRQIVYFRSETIAYMRTKGMLDANLLTNIRIVFLF